MKIFSTIAKYMGVFIGAILFGAAAVRLKSAKRSKNRADEKVRELSKRSIDASDAEIRKHTEALKTASNRVEEAKANAAKRLDNISKNSGSVGDLLDEYNRDRLRG